MFLEIPIYTNLDTEISRRKLLYLTILIQFRVENKKSRRIIFLSVHFFVISVLYLLLLSWALNLKNYYGKTFFNNSEKKTKTINRLKHVYVFISLFKDYKKL